MSFLPHLQAVVTQVEGSLACAVMGLDGIEVEAFKAPGAQDVDLGAAWAEFANVLGQQVRTEGHPAGPVQELCFSNAKCINILRVVSPEYFMVLSLSPNGNYGRGRYALRVTAPKVKAEL